LTSLCLYPPQTGLGGPASFARRLEDALRARNIEVQPDPLAPGCAAVLVIGGSKHLDVLWRARRRGVRIVQRLDGMNWLHRRLNTGLKHYLRSEINNWLLAVIRSRLADCIVYQSHFSQQWWLKVRGPVSAGETVIYNGVDLEQFSPDGPEERPADHYRLLLVEGHLGGGMVTGLHNAVDLLHELGSVTSSRWELLIAGDAPASIRQLLEKKYSGLWITWEGVVPPVQVPALDRSAHALFSADLNAACPNAVIEALACGLPVIAYATGALPEMVNATSGCVVPYGRDHWKLEPPVVPPLAEAARQIVSRPNKYRPGARARAEEKFDLQNIVNSYLDVLL
jgi:glycosyltransferase involved in cell wall biosynthesis